VTVAVVTGASRGLGRAIAVALAGAGHDIVVGYGTRDADAKDTAMLVEREGVRTALVGGDVVDPDTHTALADAAEELGRLDVWVNNAGVSILAPVVDTPLDDVRRIFDINVAGLFLGLREAVARFRAAGRGGRVINVSSEAGLQAFPNLGVYSASKFAVVGLTQAAALELADDRITVNAVCPGTAETDMVAAERVSEAALTSTTLNDVRAQYLDAIPLGRFCAPEDVGALVAYLASPGAGYVTGQSIAVNGGSVLH
jgi:meso-butanediol dehydrogenase / (S,S)-butanediol dehydrogenase / diacetyl reductase